MRVILPSTRMLSRFVLLLLGTGLAGVLTVVAVAQYRAQVTLQRTALQQVAHHSERRAIALSYFFSEQLDFVADLAAGNELSSYFENQALGMSLAYGLQASRLMVTERFDQVRRSKRLGEYPMYERLVFVDASGRLLNDSRDKGSVWRKHGSWRELLDGKRPLPAIRCDPEEDGLHLVISAPTFFKGRFAGQTLGWVSFPHMYEFFFAGQGDASGMTDAILYRGRYLHIPPAAARFLGGPLPVPPSGQRPYEPFLLGQPGAAAVYTVLVPVRNTEFALLTVMPPRELLNHVSPRLYILKLAGLAALVLGGVFLLLWSYTRIEVLKTHLEEAQLRERAEQEKLKLQEQLQQAQKMDALGSLAGGIAHDMNNVLGAILSLASTHALDPGTGTRTRRAFEIITEAATRGGRMVQSLLNFARQSPAETRRVDLNALLREVVALLERTTLGKVGLHMDLAPDLPPIQGDASALSHACINLCVNAVDAMPEHGLLTLATRRGPGATVEVTVTDNGTGMPREVLERALDPFFTTKPVGKGTGLGLALVYSTVTAHHGRMDLWSEPGRGTRVTLSFPSCDPEAPDTEPAAVAEAVSGKPLEVLVIDDDEVVRQSIAEVLEYLGHRAILAGSGEEGLACLEGGLEPDAVILDMNMPGLGGAGTLPHLRDLRPALPVLLSTGRVEQTTLDLAGQFPGVTLLSKPFNIQELQQRLAALAGAPV